MKWLWNWWKRPPAVAQDYDFVGEMVDVAPTPPPPFVRPRAVDYAQWLVDNRLTEVKNDGRYAVVRFSGKVSGRYMRVAVVDLNGSRSHFDAALDVLRFRPSPYPV